MNAPHTPIMVETFLSFFENRPLKRFIDGTVGAGGHSKALLETHPEIESYYAFDQDEEALLIAKERLAPFKEKVTFIHSNFRYLDEEVSEKVDGIFLDIGVSSMQLDRKEKGFSLYGDGPLDMRMDKSASLDASEVVNTFSEKELGALFRDLGEERRWRAAAKAIVEARRKKSLKTTLDLREVLEKVLFWKGQRIHPATRVFQALRIYVNDELGAIEEGIRRGRALLAPKGRFGVITFHSLEDRIVKHTFKEESDNTHVLTKKPLVASLEEVKQNRRSRSAKMRFIEKGE